MNAAIHPSLAAPTQRCQPLQITHLEAHVLRYPIATPVRTSFGIMHDRPAVFVRAVDADGTEGWGEIWCNFPACGAEHRARLLETVAAPLLIGQRFDNPAAAWQFLSDRTAVLAIQSGEHGPMAQTMAGIDLALWDLSARRAGEPLWRHLGGQRSQVPVYASGLNPDGPEKLAARRQQEGYRAFKLKVGFGAERDVANLQALRSTVGAATPLMVDANQAWSVTETLAMLPQLQAFDLQWLEEPLRADRPWSEWLQLRQHTAIPLAGGENLGSSEAFDTAIAAGALQVMQPDAAKWGGISGCWPAAAKAMAAGLRFCPHYLGAGIGLMASAHWLAAAGGNGMLEVDANDNPLRTELAPALAQIDSAGCMSLGDAPGIGVLPDLAALRSRITH